jgi:hypothetical protein
VEKEYKERSSKKNLEYQLPLILLFLPTQAGLLNLKIKVIQLSKVFLHTIAANIEDVEVVNITPKICAISRLYLFNMNIFLV